MNIESECITCIFNQALRVSKVLDLDQKRTKDILDIAASHVPKFSYSKTPPQNATPMYEDIAIYLKVEDIYKEIKRSSNLHAKKLKSRSVEILEKSSDKFKTALKIAVVGNVIDLASEVIFDLESEVENVINSNFMIDDSQLLKESLKRSKSIVYLADNVGENIFDAIFISYLKKSFDLNIYYFVRSKPIINDISFSDLDLLGDLNEYVTIVDSGVKTPGIVYDDLNKEAKSIFDSADTIISKGMGNYECLNQMSSFNIFFLLKVKCSVVARSLNEKIGDIICKRV